MQKVLKEGVERIRLSMTPMNHERTFKKDKIGKKLYQFYKKAKEKDDIFFDEKKPRNFVRL